MKRISYTILCFFLLTSFTTYTSQDQYDSSHDTYIDENVEEEELNYYDSESEKQEEPIFPEQREVAVNSTLSAQLHQLFTHSSPIYKEIDYHEFYKNYPSIIHTAINNAFNKSCLNNAERRHKESSIIVGEQPFDNQEKLYDCKNALNFLQKEINEYIDIHEDVVRRKCIGYVLQKTRSKDVWAPKCCDIQLHKDCFKACKQKKLNKCINLFCNNPTWSTNFYKQTVKARPHVPNLQIYDTDCPLCLEPLIVDQHIKDAQKKTNEL